MMGEEGAASVTAGLVTLGETMGLLTPAEFGPLAHATSFKMTMAGAESNVAIAVRRLGVPATWIGKVGADEVGDLIERELRAEGVRTLALRSPAAPTGLMLKTRRTSGVTRVSYFRSDSAGSRLTADDLDERLVATADALHVTGITPALGAGPAAAVRAAVETARAHRVPVALDVNYRAALWDHADAARVLRDLAGQVDVLFASEHEAVILAGPDGGADEADVLARRLAQLGPRQVVIKRGRLGSVALVDDELHCVDSLPVHSVDPVGAGDAFVGGYLAELMSGCGPATRLATATATGAFAVTVSGDWEGLPHRDELALLSTTDDIVR